MSKQNFRIKKNNLLKNGATIVDIDNTWIGFICEQIWSKYSKCSIIWSDDYFKGGVDMLSGYLVTCTDNLCVIPERNQIIIMGTWKLKTQIFVQYQYLFSELTIVVLTLSCNKI